MIEMLGRVLRSMRGRPRLIWVLGLALVGAGGVFAFVRSETAFDGSATATVRRGNLSATLTVAGILKPLQAITYHSPLAGRETEITFLAPEGTRVSEGDLLVRLDAVPLTHDLERANQELRQVQVDLQVAEIDRQEGQAAIDSLTGGEAALSVEETRTRLDLAEKKVARLRAEHEALAPLLEKGYITRDELRRTSDELEQAEQELALARRRADVLVKRTVPRDQQKAELQLAQKDAQRENVRARLQEARARVTLLKDQIENASVYAKRPGIVVYEEYMNANPRRKIRPGDRVTETPGIVTVADVDRMLVEASVGEADVHRVAVGQAVTVVLEALRDRRFAGKVTRVGTVARSSADRPLEDKRFDLVAELDQPDNQLRPEMTARVDVHLGERRGVLIIPATAVFEEQGVPAVHVVRAFDVQSRMVQLGESTGAAVEVVAGLQEGERIMLTDTARVSAPAVTGVALDGPAKPGGRGMLKSQ
jgi:RND family efflux transporter MFP subunit